VPFRWRPLGTIARRCARVGNGKWALGQTASDSEVRQIAERCGEAQPKILVPVTHNLEADDRLIENTAGETNTSRPRPWTRCPRMYSSSGRDIGRGLLKSGGLLAYRARCVVPFAASPSRSMIHTYARCVLYMYTAACDGNTSWLIHPTGGALSNRDAG
jgi:hypothetical protein